MSAARSNGSAWPWLAAGAALGIAAGLAIGAELAHINRASVRRALRRLTTAPVPPTAPSAALGKVRQALAAVPALAGLAFRLLPVRPGVIELHGWVETRAQRTLAVRTVRATPGVDEVINCLLVRGEDDRGRSAVAVADGEIS